MDQDQEQRHVCRFCNKSFLSGKVLGGHMRCHGTKNSAKTETKKRSAKDGERSGYGLRVNPKKSSRISDSDNLHHHHDDHDHEPSSGQDIFCRVCGKVFETMRALFGHMRHHSGKRKKEEVHCKECGREFGSLRSLTGHMKSHSEKKRFLKLFGETCQLVRKKRSSRRLLRYDKVASPSNCSFSNNLSESSSGVVEHDLKEVEEVAFCLLMLSRGVHSWEEFCSVNAESSDNNSSPSDNKSPNRVLVKKPRVEKLELLDEKRVSEFSENDFGLVESDGEEKMVSLEASVYNDDDDDVDHDMIPKLADIEIKKEKESENGMRIINSVEVESEENNQRQELDLVPHSKKSKYKCRTCNKIFQSHQALGGHQTIHRPAKNNFAAFQFDCDFPGIEAEHNENSMELEKEMDKLTVTSYETINNSNIKEHKCHICFKVFASGQALGGHKRAHIVRDSEIEADQITLMKQEGCDISNVLDVNVSLTLGDEEANTDVQLKPWWVNNDHNHEVLVGLMPN